MEFAECIFKITVQLKLRLSTSAGILLLACLYLYPQGEDFGDEDPLRFREARIKMVKTQIEARGISDRRVLDAMIKIPRHLFVLEYSRGRAYGDFPLPIGEGQTISQPYIVAFMTEQLRLKGQEKVLEIGTGSGYQAAVLSVMAKQVYSVEIKKSLHEQSTATLKRLGFTNVATSFADGYYGWEQEAPFDAIMITAAVNHIPPPLLEQLAEGGTMILPLGNPYSYLGQVLVLVTKTGQDFKIREILPVRFVPMTGRALESTN